MKDLLIVANWKENKTKKQALEYFEDFTQYSKIEGKEVVICPPFTLLDLVSSEVSDKALLFKIGSQDVSRFSEGAYTGEIAASQIREFAEFVLIGHSERRSNFSEGNSILFQKVKEVLKAGLAPVYCVSDSITEIPQGVNIVAYEPLDAIGTGRPDTTENASRIAEEIKEKNEGVNKVLYGGSVNSNNVNSFTSMPHIDGVLVGGASLDSSEFLKIIENA